MAARPRVVSLLPSATEILCALGLGEQLVGVSHECDFPPQVTRLPRLTGSRIDARGGAAIDRQLRGLQQSALSLYPLDLERLAALRPDVIVTQDLCAVCAVPRAEVEQAVSQLGLAQTEIVALSPLRLDDVLRDVERVAQAVGRDAAGGALAASMRARFAAIGARTAAFGRRPSVLTLEWLSPPMIGGTWMPELVELAGGRALGARAGERAPTCTLDELRALEPEVVVIKPCGFDLERTHAERAVIEELLAELGGTARARGAVFLADGNAFFNRPGPRLCESLEILSACVHPEAARELGQPHAASWAAWRTDQLGSGSRPI